MTESFRDVWAAQFDVLLLDLDGVVYAGSDAIPFAVESLSAVAEAGVRLAYVTNNASRPPSAVVSHLTRLGLQPHSSDVVTSAQAGARLLHDSLEPGADVLVVGGEGLHEAVAERGLRIVDSGIPAPAAVIMGFSPDVSWRELAQATYAVTGGATFVATNTDASIPTADGIAPGNGMLVQVVAQVTGTQPLVAGKPELPLMRESVERTRARRPLVVGDRLDTDIAGAARARLPSLLVLTGVSSVADLLAAGPGLRPDYLAADLRALIDGPVAVTRASHARPDPAEAAHPDDWLRSVAAATRSAWAAADRGNAVDAAGISAELLGARPTENETGRAADSGSPGDDRVDGQSTDSAGKRDL